MTVVHDEVELEDFEYDPETEAWYYDCPCGDKFIFTTDDLKNKEEFAYCPSCTLVLRVIYEVDLIDDYLQNLTISAY